MRIANAYGDMVQCELCKEWLQRGALGPIRDRKTVEKIIQNRNTEKNSIKTENRMQNCQNRYIFTSQLLKP